MLHCWLYYISNIEIENFTLYLFLSPKSQAFSPKHSALHFHNTHDWFSVVRHGFNTVHVCKHIHIQAATYKLIVHMRPVIFLSLFSCLFVCVYIDGVSVCVVQECALSERTAIMCVHLSTRSGLVVAVPPYRRHNYDCLCASTRKSQRRDSILTCIPYRVVSYNNCIIPHFVRMEHSPCLNEWNTDIDNDTLFYCES